MNFDPGLAVPLALAVVFALLRWLVPPRKRQDEGPRLTDEERASFRKWELAAVALWVVLAAALAFAWYGAFRVLAAIVMRPGTMTLFLLAPDPEAVGIPAIFLGIVLAMTATDLVLRALLRDRHARFELASQAKARFDTRKVVAGLYWLVAAMTVAFFVWWAGSITRIGADGIDVGSGFSLRREPIPYARVRAVQVRHSFRAPNGNVIWRRHHAVVFGDGTEWTTRNALRAPLDSDAEAMAYVAEHAGRVIETTQ